MNISSVTEHKHLFNMAHLYLICKSLTYLLRAILNPNPSLRVSGGDWYLTSGI